MAYCKYHPLEAATYRCHSCQIAICDQCIDDSSAHKSPRCFLCEAELVSLGAGQSVPPFWRRLQEAFRYPLNAGALALIIGCAALSSLLGAFPVFGLLTFVFLLLITGIFVKYCFFCLESTAQGEMTAPQVGEAFQGGVVLLLKLLGILIAQTLLVVGLARLSASLAGVFALVLVISLPAVLMRFAQSESVLEAINPLNALQLIVLVGLPYGLLLGFIVVMMGSVGVINQLIGTHFTVVSLILQSAVSNYYTVVVFHLMGYMLFQYQHRLGYTARVQVEVAQHRSEKAVLAAKITVFIKEGEYEAATDLYRLALRKFPVDADFRENYLQLLCSVGDCQRLRRYADDYLQFLLSQHQLDRLLPAMRRIQQWLADYQPQTAALRLALARQLAVKESWAEAAKMLKGLHQAFPAAPELVDAYKLLAEILERFPAKRAQAEKCRCFANHLQQRANQSRSATKVQQRAEGPGKTSNSEQDGALPPIDFQ